MLDRRSCTCSTLTKTQTGSVFSTPSSPTILGSGAWPSRSYSSRAMPASAKRPLTRGMADPSRLVRRTAVDAAADTEDERFRPSVRAVCSRTMTPGSAGKPCARSEIWACIAAVLWSSP